MKIIIDLQSLQGNNRNRGIGRYSLALSQAILQHPHHHEISLCLNNNDIENIENIRSKFKALIPDDHIKIFEIPKIDNNKSFTNFARSKIAEKIRENFIANLNPDLIYVSSIFEQGKDDIPISIGEFNQSSLNTATLYDLIPFKFYKHYIKDNNARNFLFQKMQILKKNNLILTISDYVAKEAIDILGIPRQSIVNCSVGIDSKFKKIDINPLEKDEIKKTYGIKKEFIFYLGGLDFRKNVNGLIAAYSVLPKDLRNKFQLFIIVSDVVDSVKPYLNEFIRHYNLESNEIILQNHISEDDLIKLYNMCSLFVFPSLHEGFGLPILEAMACGAPTITSDTSSMPEAVGCEEALFNPKDSQSIACKIHEVLTNKNITNFLKEHATNQIKKFTWEKTAKKTLQAFEDLYTENQNLNKINCYTGFNKKKMAFVSPLPKEKTGIADYSAQLLPDLAVFYEITLITNQESIDDHWLNANFSIKNNKWFIKHANSFEIIVYQFGNSHYHYFMLELLNLYPGVIVLHDFFLSGLYQWADVMHEKEQYTFYRSIYYSHGFPALIEWINKDRHSIIEKYPCNLFVLKRALGIIVLSQHTIDLAYQWYGSNMISKFSLVNAPHLPKEISPLSRKKIRKQLGYGKNDLLICTFGFIGETKQCHRTILACADLILSKVNFYLIFVGGKVDEKYNQFLESLIKKNALEKKVKFIGFVTSETFNDYLTIADIAVQLRTKSRGETSACILNCLSYGIPTIVNNHGSIQEISDNVVVKLKNEFTDWELTEKIFNLYKKNTLRKDISQKSLKYIEEKHHPVRTSRQYYQAIENFYSFVNVSFRERYLIQNISSENFHLLNKENLRSISTAISANRLPLSYPQLLIDISFIKFHFDYSSITSLFINLLKTLLSFSIKGFRVETIYYNNILNRYCYATNLSTNFLNLENKLFGNIPIEISSQDVLFIGTSIFEEIEINHYLKTFHAKGTKIYFIISNESLINKHNISQQNTITLKSNLNRIIKFNRGFLCMEDETFDLLTTFLNKHSISKNKKIKIGRIFSKKNNVDIDKLKELILEDKWDIILNYKNNIPLNDIFTSDSCNEIA